MTISYDIHPETFAQANPFLTGWQAGQQITSQDIANRVAGATAPYAGPTAAVDLATKQAMLPYIGYQQMGQYFSGLGKMFGNMPAYKLIGLGQDPNFKAAMANNPQLAQQYSNAITMAGNWGGGMGLNGTGLPMPPVPGQQGNQSQGNQSQGGMQQQQGMPQNTSGYPMPTNIQQAGQMGYNVNQIMGNLPPPQSQQSAQAQQYMQPMIMKGQPQQAQNSSYIPVPDPYNNASQTQAIVSQNANDLIKANINPAQQQQLIYTNSADNMFGQFAKTLPGVASYSGTAGKAQLAKDMAAVAAGKQPSANYQSYQNYLTAAIPFANDIRRGLGDSATDQQQEVMKELTDPVGLTISPQQALGKWQQLMDSLQENKKAIMQPISQTYSQAINSPSPQVPGAPQNQAPRVTVMSPDGKRGTISASNLQAAIQAGYKQVNG